MAALDENAVLRNGGRLYVNPTDMTDVPSGLGTELGIVIGAALEFGLEYGDVASEDDSIEGKHYLGHEAEFSAILRARDDDAYETVFPNWTAGATGRPIVRGRGAAIAAGAEVSSVALLFVPNRINDIATAPAIPAGLAIYAPRAYPEVEATARARLATVAEATIPVLFTLAPGSTGETFLMGTLSDIAAIV